MSSRHPIIVVTGANSGVGFGICHRLLKQLSHILPDDALPRDSRGMPTFHISQASPFSPVERLTLVLACRNPGRAAAARQRLLALMDEEVAHQKKANVLGGCAEELRKNLCIDFIPLDLSSMESIFDFAEEANSRYPYITHLILNAGILCITGLDWLECFKQSLTEPIVALTTPRYLLQNLHAETPDGLDLVWQSNVFGHYSLFRLLEKLLRKNPYLDSRVEWLSSLDALPDDFDPSDTQLRRTKSSYQVSKYQIDLIATLLARNESQEPPPNGTAYIHHLLVHPGVCCTNMVSTFLGSLLNMLYILSFYMARLIGSPHHTIHGYKAATAASHAALTPKGLIKDLSNDPPQKYGSRVSRWGKEYVDMDLLIEWKNNVATARDLLAFCEKFFTIFEQRRRGSHPTTNGGNGLDNHVYTNGK